MQTTKTNKEGINTNNKHKIIVYEALLASLYIILTLLAFPISFLNIQFRISEILILLAFFNKKHTIGLTIGCVIANLASSLGPIDAIFGGLATLLSCLLLSISKYLLPSLILTILINAFTIGGELNLFLKEPFFISSGLVAIGEATILIVGYILFLFFKKRKNFSLIILANQNIDYKW